MFARRRNRKRPRDTENAQAGESEKIKQAKPVNPLLAGPMKMVRQVLSNPNLSYQAMVIILALASDNVNMDRRINTMSSSLESLRGITEVVNNSIRSLQTASEAPRQIRKLMNPGKE
ncbi:MAG: hypothetical protein P4N41_24885 [Negativicutes bacterium]|nr:hypothetical protein [Negativicutes bacterium]